MVAGAARILNDLVLVIITHLWSGARPPPPRKFLKSGGSEMQLLALYTQYILGKIQLKS